MVKKEAKKVILKDEEGNYIVPVIDPADKGSSGLELCDIGIALYVDETKGLRRYLNGQIVDINTNTQAFLSRLEEITTLHPSLLCTEEEWQTAKTMSAFGQVGKFVFNYNGDEIVSVRIPAIVNVQGLFDLQNLGMTVEAGLPNITGTYRYSTASGTAGAGNGTGAITANGGTSNYGFSAGSNNITRPNGFNFNASNLNPIYGNSPTVQEEAIQYPYFIQIATGSETEANIVNTLENVKGFTLLESKYSDKPLYNESWLLSNGQWNAKSLYPTAYEGLQVEYNSGIEAGTTVTLPSGVSYTKRGLSVKLSTDSDITDYDFVLNTADETFRLPLKTKLASGKAVVGNGMTLGLTDGTASGGLAFSTSGNSHLYSSSGIGSDLGSTSGSSDGFTNNTFLGITTDTTKSGIETSSDGLYLYFYVGDLDQNHGIVNMGRIGEALTGKADITTPSIQAPYIKDTYKNGNSWYRIWSDGWCEQGGVSGNNSASNARTTVTLLKPYRDTAFNVIVGTRGGAFQTERLWRSETPTANNSFVIRLLFTGNATNGNLQCVWETTGYLAEGNY